MLGPATVRATRHASHSCCARTRRGAIFGEAPDATVNSASERGGSECAVAVDETQELGAGAGVLAEHSEHSARDHLHAALVDATSRHALVRGVDDHADAAWPQNAV